MLRIVPLAATLCALIGAPVTAQQSAAPTPPHKRTPQDAAKVFTLDSATLPDDLATPTQPQTTVRDDVPAQTPSPVTPSTVPIPTADAVPSTGSDVTAPAAATTNPAAAPATPDPAANAPIVTTLGQAASLDTPIAQLIADPRAKAVLDRDLPGLTSDENLVRFQKLSLRKFQPMTGGQLTPELLAKVGADLAALDEKATTTLAPSSTPKTTQRGKLDQGR